VVVLEVLLEVLVCVVGVVVGIVSKSTEASCTLSELLVVDVLAHDLVMLRWDLLECIRSEKRIVPVLLISLLT